jgi:hypothetical protein
MPPFNAQGLKSGFGHDFSQELSVGNLLFR